MGKACCALTAGGGERSFSAKSQALHASRSAASTTLVRCVPKDRNQAVSPGRAGSRCGSCWFTASRNRGLCVCWPAKDTTCWRLGMRSVRSALSVFSGRSWCWSRRMIRSRYVTRYAGLRLGYRSSFSSLPKVWIRGSPLLTREPMTALAHHSTARSLPLGCGPPSGEGSLEHLCRCRPRTYLWTACHEQTPAASLAPVPAGPGGRRSRDPGGVGCRSADQFGSYVQTGGDCPEGRGSVERVGQRECGSRDRSQREFSDQRHAHGRVCP